MGRGCGRGGVLSVSEKISEKNSFSHQGVLPLEAAGVLTPFDPPATTGELIDNGRLDGRGGVRVGWGGDIKGEIVRGQGEIGRGKRG